MWSLSALTAVLVIGLTAEHKRPDPAARKPGGSVVRRRQCRGREKSLSFVSISAGVLTKQSREVTNTSWAGLSPAGLSTIGASMAIKVNVPMVASMRYAVIAQRGHLPIKGRTMKVT
jgi:hypothetical protein